jgi:flavin-dependent dehydrogenase
MSLSRYALDSSLAAHAEALGVEVRTQTAVSAVHGTMDREGFQLRLQTGTSYHEAVLRSRTVIGAYGKRSSLDRQLKRTFFDTQQPFLALKAHFQGDSLHERIELHVFPGGYCGLSEVENDTVNVCLLVQQDIFKQHSAEGSIDAFIGWMRRQNPRLEHWMENANPIFESWLSIAQIPFARKSLVENDILMTGDASGVIAPLAGSGMGMALQSGQLAACYIDAFLTNKLPAREVTRQYGATWQRIFGTRFRTGRFLQYVMLHPSLIRAGLRLVNAGPALGRFFVHQTRDTSLSKHRITL